MITNINHKEHMNKSGIYIITNTINGKVYIGRTNSFHRRVKQYGYAFSRRKLKHINSYLLSSMVKYEFDNFKFEILEECYNGITPERELYWINFYNSNHRDKGYNLRLDVSGKMLTDKRTSEKISQRLKKEWSLGVRKDHSIKLKESWVNRDRAEQGKLFSKSLTKYKYLIDGQYELNYKLLKLLDLHGCLQKYYEKKTNKVIFKGLTIERVLINGKD